VTDTTTLGSFRFIQIIGEGIHGKLFLAQHKITKKKYAIKAIRKDKLLQDGSEDNA